MAVGVRFTKDERSYIRSFMTSDSKVAQAILDKLDASEMVKSSAKATGIGWKAAADAMREVLGSSLALPPRPDLGWMARMSNRIRELGLTVDDCRIIAIHLKNKRWTSYSFDRSIWIADRLLAEAKASPGSLPEPKRWASAPIGVDDT